MKEKRDSKNIDPLPVVSCVLPTTPHHFHVPGLILRGLKYFHKLNREIFPDEIITSLSLAMSLSRFERSRLGPLLLPRVVCCTNSSIFQTVTSVPCKQYR